MLPASTLTLSLQHGKYLEGDIHDRLRKLFFLQVPTGLVGEGEALVGLVQTPPLAALCLAHKDLHIVVMRG